MPLPSPTPTPSTSLLVDDAFTRVLSGGWGSIGGRAWAITISRAADYSINGSVGRIVESATGTRYALQAVSARNTSTILRFRFTSIPTRSWNAVSVLARTTGTGRWYSVRVRSLAGARDTIEFGRRTAAGLVRIGSIATVPEFSAGTWYTLRLLTKGDGISTILRARVWKAGTTEPTTWRITVKDATGALQGPGGVGLRLTSTSTAQRARAEFDWFRTRPL